MLWLQPGPPGGGGLLWPRRPRRARGVVPGPARGPEGPLLRGQVRGGQPSQRLGRGRVPARLRGPVRGHRRPWRGGKAERAAGDRGRRERRPDLEDAPGVGHPGLRQRPWRRRALLGHADQRALRLPAGGLRSDRERAAGTAPCVRGGRGPLRPDGARALPGARSVRARPALALPRRRRGRVLRLPGALLRGAGRPFRDGGAGQPLGDRRRAAGRALPRRRSLREAGPSRSGSAA